MNVLKNFGLGIQEPSGEARGVVVDEAGDPVKDMKVSLNYAGSALQIAMVPTVETGINGQFAFLHCEFGPYFISTGTPHYLSTGVETHGYVDTLYDFYQSRPNPRVVLDDVHPIVNNIRIIVGPKGGTIYGTVSNAMTGGEISDTSFRFWNVRNKIAFIELNPLRIGSYARQLGVRSGSFQELMPSGIEIGLSVNAPGYQTWYYADSTTGENNFTVPPGGTKSINIRMIPNPVTKQ